MTPTCFDIDYANSCPRGNAKNLSEIFPTQHMKFFHASHLIYCKTYEFRDETTGEITYLRRFFVSTTYLVNHNYAEKFPHLYVDSLNGQSFNISTIFFGITF